MGRQWPTDLCTIGSLDALREAMRQYQESEARLLRDVGPGDPATMATSSLLIKLEAAYLFRRLNATRPERLETWRRLIVDGGLEPDDAVLAVDGILWTG